PSILIPYSRLSQPPEPGPWIVKSLILTFVDPVTSTTVLLADIDAGAWIVAAWLTDWSVRPFLPAGIATCSVYVPEQTLIVSPGPAALTAARIDENELAPPPQLTVNVLPAANADVAPSTSMLAPNAMTTLAKRFMYFPLIRSRHPPGGAAVPEVLPENRYP